MWPKLGWEHACKSSSPCDDLQSSRPPGGMTQKAIYKCWDKWVSIYSMLSPLVRRSWEWIWGLQGLSYVTTALGIAPEVMVLTFSGHLLNTTTCTAPGRLLWSEREWGCDSMPPTYMRRWPREYFLATLQAGAWGRAQQRPCVEEEEVQLVYLP